tara:strand:- start:18633 stop:19139 length:507 start_codon:yes stop_codon:yes gene_type:complete
MKFTNTLKTEDVDRGCVKLLTGFGFVTDDDILVCVPPERVTNYASIPRFFRWLLPPNGSYKDAAVIHDEMVDERRSVPVSWRYYALDYTVPEVQGFAERLDYIASSRAYWREIGHLKGFKVPISPDKSNEIFLQAMKSFPSPTNIIIRKVIHEAIKRFGPSWATPDGV